VVKRDEERALALISEHGRTSTAFQALARGLSHWFLSVDSGATNRDLGLVAYAAHGGAWIAAGEPIASEVDAVHVAECFVQAARAERRRASFFATEGNLASSPRFRRTLIGEQPVWDPQDWAAKLKEHRSLREQLRRARAKGVVIRRVTGETLSGDAALRDTLQAMIARWLAARTMSRMRFLVDVNPLEHLDHRQLFVAERHDSVVGLLSLSPVPARDGWLFEHLLRDPAAPNGTSELLVHHAMRELAQRGDRWATLGLAPLSGPISGWLRAARSVSRPLFNFDGLAAFKRKLRPDRWAPIYLVYPRESNSAVAMLDGLRAFAGGSLFGFAMRTALRGPRPLLRALELLLIPWTIGLALLPTQPWFPSALVHMAWTLFDIGLLVALGRLRRTGNVTLARVIAAAVSIDAMLTLVQAFVYTIPALRRVGSITYPSLLGIAVACAGPLVATPVLWGAARRLARLQAAGAVARTSRTTG
jgi:phosphatidylglycerol lysyltransferase